MASQAGPVPDWLLERLAADELPASQARALHATLAARGESERLAALAASNAEILAALPPARVVAEVERRLQTASGRRPARRLRPLWALSLAAACATGLAVFVALRSPTCPDGGSLRTSDGECIALKGLGPSLRVHRKTASGSEALAAGALVHQGDTLQLGYVAAGKQFGVIASIDARGTITLHLPETPGPAARLERGGERALGHSYELDDSPGFERFVFVAADQPFATADVVARLKQQRALPAALVLFELTLQKENP
jgi:hypothetical protein